MNTLTNILVVKNRAMGDSIMGVSTLEFIRSLYPQATIYYAVPRWVEPLYRNVITPADKIIPIELSHLSGWIDLWGEVLSISPDIIFEMHLSGRSYKFFKLYSIFNKVKYFFHNHHFKKATIIHDQGVIKSLIQRDLDGAWSTLGGCIGPPPSFLAYTPKLRFKQSSAKLNRVILGVVATRLTKIWPLEHFVKLTRLLKNYDPSLEISIPLSRSEFDYALERELKKLGVESSVKFVKMPLSDLPKYMAESLLYIGNDTGLKHLAVSVGVKTYTFFGPEPPEEWHPYSAIDHPYFYVEPLECRTRVAHFCGLSHCESMICLNQISADMVFEAVKKDLKFSR